MARSTCCSPGFNATAFIFQLKNRFREDYRDVQHGDHRITQLIDVSVVVQAPDLEKMTDRTAALKAFEDFGRRLVENPPQLPAPGQ